MPTPLYSTDFGDSEHRTLTAREKALSMGSCRTEFTDGGRERDVSVERVLLIDVTFSVDRAPEPPARNRQTRRPVLASEREAHSPAAGVSPNSGEIRFRGRL